MVLFCRLLFHLDSTLAYQSFESTFVLSVSRVAPLTDRNNLQDILSKTNRIEQVKGCSVMYFFCGLDIQFKIISR